MSSSMSCAGKSKDFGQPFFKRAAGVEGAEPLIAARRMRNPYNVRPARGEFKKSVRWIDF